MSREVLLEQLRTPLRDPEGSHSTAEKLLVEYLRSMGDNELADAWLEARDVQNWWYA